MTALPWWKTAVVYQIYPRSFADHNADGVGDLRGLTARLDHLSWLGVDALWVSPFYRSPMRDFGYDVSDYCDVDPLFGTLADFDVLLEAAHARGLKVMIDWVPSHTSDQHPWFVAARASRDCPERNFYVFRDPAPDGGPPNGWRAAFPLGKPAWTLDAQTGQYYLHSFLPEQPDLNWAEPRVAEAMHEILRFWLDRGVDGFRADVVHNLVKDPALPELPEGLRDLPCMLLNDQPGTHARLRDIRRLLDSYPGDRAMVGEVFLLDSAQVAGFYGQGDELHLCFNFTPLYSPWDAAAWRTELQKVQSETAARGGWPTWVLGNHDQRRLRTRLGGSEARCRAAAVLLLTLHGSPFVYMGEELGLEDAVVTGAAVVDPGGRDGCRAPMPWTAEAGHGWARTPWLPFSPESAARSVQAQREQPEAIVHLYRRLLALRKRSPALTHGAQALLDGPEGVLGYARTEGEEELHVWINFTERSVGLPQAGAAQVVLSTDARGEGERFGNVLAPDQAVILRAL